MSFMTSQQAEECYSLLLKVFTKNDVCWAWDVRQRCLGVLNCEELTHQICGWQNSREIYKCNPKNNIEVSDGQGRTYYCLTVQLFEKNGELSEDNPMSGFHLLKFGVMINGLTYYFTSKNIRDGAFKCITDKEYSLEKLKKEREIEALNRRAHLKELEKQRDELEIVIAEKIAETVAEKLIAESDGSVESEKSNKSNSSSEKSKTREANKNRDAKKKEKEDFIKHAAECARILAQQEAKKLALKKAKAKAQKK